MFPYRDDNPTLRTPVVTIALIAANVAAWIFLQGAGMEPALSRSVCELGAIPADLLGRLPPGAHLRLSDHVVCAVGSEPAWHTVLTSMFMHGGWAHLLGNMWFLWIFGNNVEDSTGRLRFLVFYLLCGFAAVAAQVLTSPSSAVPMVGASGAISGVMGAYIVLYPRIRVHLLVILGFFVTTFTVPAYLMLGYWLILQIIGGLPQLSTDAAGVAFWAHVGGFVAGAVLIYVFQDSALVMAHRRTVAEMYRRMRPDYY